MPLNDKRTSFSLARTNPKISGNIKITVDSEGLIYLNSLDATKELSASDFKKFRIGTTGSSYEADLKNFIGQLPTGIVFAANEKNPNPVNTSESFKDQYDFFYNMGAENLISKFYDEEYSYFAPLWLRSDLPEYFVIFRVDEPLDFPYNVNVPSGDIEVGKTYIVKGDASHLVTYANTTYQNGQTFIGSILGGPTYTSTGVGKVILLDENKDIPVDNIEQFKKIAKKAHVIKTFDLSENSNIGKYIRNIVNSKFFPSSPITVRFDDGLLTTWNGVSYKDGSMTSKGELLSDYWAAGHLQIDFEEYITNGFERHGIICPYLLNLEFLFNDDETSMYSMPRYFGFYVNAIELSSIQLDGDALYENRSTSGNIPAPKRPNRGFRHQGEDFYQSNPNGVRLYYQNETSFVPSSDTFLDEEVRFYWVQDKNGNFYSLDQTGKNKFNLTSKDIVVRNKSINLGDFAGPGAVRIQDKGSRLTENGRSYMVIKIKDQLLPNDKIFLYWNLGYYADLNGKYHSLIANDLSKRPFTVPANGTTLTISGVDVTSQYVSGQIIQLNYGSGNSVLRKLSAAPTLLFGNTILSIDNPIDTTTTSGSTPIVPGWGPGSALISDNNDTIYYHPYGTMNQIATSIASAFNLIENRTFDAVAIDDQIVIRMRKGESITNNFFVMAQLTLTNEMHFQGSQFVPGNKYFFEGGTDSAKIRLKFPYPATDILKNGEAFIKTKRGISKVEFVGRYVDEEVLELGGSDIGSLNGFKEYGALYITDHLDEPIVTTSGDFIAYDLYDIPVGLFSIFNIKDIDGDFFSSTYSRSPIAEVNRYFDVLADTPNVLVPGRKYLIKSEDPTDSISYLGNTYYASLNGGNNTMPYEKFIAGKISNELSATGNGAIKNFKFNVLYAPVEPNSYKLTDSIENFTDDGNGNLIGTSGGTGTINYDTGAVDVTFLGPVINTQHVLSSYNSLSGFTVLSGSPIVVAQIFHASHVLPNTQLDPTHKYVLFGDPTERVIDSFGAYKSASYEGSQALTPGSTYYVFNTGHPLVIDVTKFEMDPDLSSFAGFWTLKDLIDVSNTTDTSTIEFKNREKFKHHDIPTEYDYLKENFCKEESVKSRIFPFISKWAYQGGDDVRDNPYRLNVNPVFGAMSFAPSFVIKSQNPEGFSHEWPYLEQPPQQYPKGTLKDNYYFFYDRIDLNRLKDANPAHRDYFTDYFTFLPADNAPAQERYNIFSYNAETGLCEVFFRGIKIRIKEIIKDTQIQPIQGIKPPFKDKSSRYAGYKFSAILRPIKQDPNKIQAPVNFTLIENKTNKTILFTIDLVIEDYKTLTLSDPSMLGTYSGSPIVNYPDTLDTHIDYLLMYSMKSKKSEKTTKDSSSSFVVGLDGNDLGDIKLSIGMNPSSPSGQIGTYTVINVDDNPDYDWDLRDEIRNFNAENLFTGSFIFGDTEFPYPLAVSQTQIFFGLPGANYPQVLNPTNDPALRYKDFQAPSGTSIFIPYGAQFDWQGYPWTQKHGGNLYLEPIMQRLSFGRIAEKVNSYSPYIKYRTYSWDTASLTTKETKDEFYIELIEPTKIVKTETVLPQIDEDKPEEFKNESIIGVNYVKTGYFNELYRYPGPYEPKFKNIMFFKDQKTDAISGPTIDLSFKQATLNPSVDGFGNIDNLGYLKVSTHDVLSLANNPKYDSRYPLLHEVPIDKRDFFTFQSNWDPGFYRIYTTKSNYFPQAGTREMKELKNFLGTKIMKTHQSVRLQDWTIEPQLSSLDQININNYSGEIVYAIVAGKLQAIVNVQKRLLRFLISDGASTEFIKYLMPEFGTGDPDSLTDDVNDYLISNVLPTYEVGLVDLYIRKYKENLNLAIIRGDLTDAQKLQQLYILDKNFTVQKKSDFVYYFEYMLDNSFNVSLAPSITISKI